MSKPEAQVAAPALAPILCTLQELTKKIRAYDRLIVKMAEVDYPTASVLMQVNGVGTLTAVAFMTALGDPKRFKSSRHVGSYLGLCPKRNASGSSDPQMRITKAGNRSVRRLLLVSANYILGPFGKDCDLRRWGLARLEGGGKNAKKRTVAAIARKLAVLLHRLWSTGEVYDPLRNAKQSATTDDRASLGTVAPATT